MAYNLTYPCHLKKSGAHTDLNKDHKTIIIYLQNDEYELGTIIYDKMIANSKTSTFTNNRNMNILKETNGKKDTGIMFDGKYYHEAYFPKKDKRIVLVVNL